MAKPQHRRSEDDAKWFGRRNAFSGGQNDNKLDLTGEGYYRGSRMENKYTTKKSYSVNKEYWRLLEQQALITGDTPILRIDFGDLKLIVLREDHYRNTMEND